MKAQISVLALLGTFLVPQVSAHYGSYIDLLDNNQRVHRRYDHRMHFTDESDAVSFFDKSVPFIPERRTSPPSHKLKHTDAVPFFPPNPDKLYFGQKGHVRSPKAAQHLPLKDIFLQLQPDNPPLEIAYGVPVVEPIERPVVEPIERPVVEPIERIELQDTLPVVSQPSYILDEAQQEEQCDAAYEVFEDLKNGKFTGYYSLFSNTDSQHPILGWSFNPLLSILLPQFAMFSKQNNGHVTPYRPLPIEFIQEASDLPLITQVPDVNESSDQQEIEEENIPLISQEPLPEHEEVMFEASIIEEEQAPLLASHEEIDSESSGILSTVGKWISSTAEAVHRFLFF